MSLPGEVAFFGTRYKRLDPTTNQYKSILIQAHNLKSQVFHYDTTLDNCSDSTTAIYVSSRHTDLPIVIDTGASNSISPIGSDFMGDIRKPDLETLKQVNGTTPVAGQGDVQWNIEDFYGTRRSIITEHTLFLTHKSDYFLLKCIYQLTLPPT